LRSKIKGHEQQVEINVVGDRYDMGVVVTTKVKGKTVSEQILDGEQPYKWKNKEYENYNEYAAAVAKDYGVEPTAVKRTTDEGPTEPYIEINVVGDRYDGGVVVTTRVDGKKINQQILDGEQDYKWQGKTYNHYEKYAKAVADEYGVGPSSISRTTDEGRTPYTKIGKALKLKDLDKFQRLEAERLFRSKQRESIKTIDDLYGKNNEIAIAHQKRINRIGRQIKKETGIDYKPPPFRAAKDQIKARARVEQKVKDKYGGEYDLITDIVRASFVVERTAEVARIIKRLEKEFEILDEGFNHSVGNYLDRKLLVRFKDGRIGEIQIVEKNFYHAKYKAGGNELYYRLRNLHKVKNAKEYKQLVKEMEDLYGAALNRSNKEWKSLSETLSASDSTSVILTSRQGRSGLDLEKAAASSEDSTKTAGIPSHQAKDVTLSQSNKGMDPIIRKDTESIYLNDPELKRIMDEEVIEAQRIIDEAGDDLEVPFTLIDDLGNEVTIVEGIKKVFNDLDEEKKSLDSLNKCMGRAA